MKDVDFSGKVAVVTGAASGMGLMASQEFARLGAKVVMCDVNADALGAAAKAIGAAAFPCAGDVRQFAHAEAAAEIAESLGGCDILVTCAGGNEARCCKSNVPFYEQPVEVIDWGLDVNLKGAVYFARAMMPQMVAKKGGVICCLGSVTGFEGDGVGTMYGTHNVRALCVTPGPVLTRAAMSGMPTALGRAGETHELVDVILFMCSDNASFVTGTNHVIDGGRLCMYRPYVAP